MHLNELLGTKTPAGCFALSRNDMTDEFTIPGSTEKFSGEDATKHRNSWLMPRFARRMTRNNKYHVANWRQNPSIDADECQKLHEVLAKKLGPIEARANLPKACQEM